MKCAVICFTDSGEKIAKVIEKGIPDAHIYSPKTCPSGVKSQMAMIAREYDRIVFVCAERMVGKES